MINRRRMSRKLSGFFKRVVALALAATLTGAALPTAYASAADHNNDVLRPAIPAHPDLAAAIKKLLDGDNETSPAVQFTSVDAAALAPPFTLSRPEVAKLAKSLGLGLYPLIKLAGDCHAPQDGSSPLCRYRHHQAFGSYDPSLGTEEDCKSFADCGLVFVAFFVGWTIGGGNGAAAEGVEGGKALGDKSISEDPTGDEKVIERRVFDGAGHIDLPPAADANLIAGDIANSLDAAKSGESIPEGGVAPASRRETEPRGCAPSAFSPIIVRGRAAVVQNIACDRSLGEDPATGRFREAEYETAIRIEQERGVTLRRDPSGRVDWRDAHGKTYDAVGSFDAKYFVKQLPTLKARIRDHLAKADYVPVDCSKFTAEQVRKVEDDPFSFACPSEFVPLFRRSLPRPR